MTIFGSHGRVPTEESKRGQVAFIKQGYGHYIEQAGDEPTRLLILFNSGSYEEISLSAWLGANPDSLLADNFGISKQDIDKVPVKSEGISAKRG